MKNILTITQREYLTQVKKKSFIILTLLAPLLIVGFGVLITFMFKANETSHTFNVIDKSGYLQDKLKSDEQIQYIIVSPATEQSLISSLKTMKGIDGLLIVPPLVNGDFDKFERETRLLINKKIGFDTKKTIAKSLEEIVRHQKMQRLGLDSKEMKNLNKNFSLNTLNVTDQNQEDDDLAFVIKYSLSMVLMYVVFMFIIIYGVRVMRSVLEEKNNRVVEIIISSVKPFELMMGKILGVTLVALTQFSIWIIMTLVATFLLNASFISMQEKILNITPEEQQQELLQDKNFEQTLGEISHILLELNFPLIIFVFILFFLLGYIFYSSIYAAIGSTVDTETETQQFTLFAILPLTIGVYGSITVISNPEGPMAFWLSMIPFTSPVAMVARISFGVPIWEIALSATLLVMMTLFMVFVAAKVYRVGILMYGNKATIKQIWHWIKS